MQRLCPCSHSKNWLGLVGSAGFPSLKRCHREQRKVLRVVPCDVALPWAWPANAQAWGGFWSMAVTGAA